MSAKMDKVLNGLLAKGTAALLMGGLAVAGPAAAAEIKFKTDGGLKWETDDGKAKGQFGGRIMVDLNAFDDDAVSHDAAAEFRRLRFFTKASYQGYDAKLQFDFSDGIEIQDAYISRKAFGGKITGGQFKQPFGLEELTSSKYITFAERGFISNGIATGRTPGLSYSTNSDHHTFAISGYDPAGLNGDEADLDGAGFGARYTWAPHVDKGNVTHFGIAVASEERDDRVRVRYRPSHVGDRTTLLQVTDTAGGEAEIDVTKLGLEAALVRGSFSAQAEWAQMEVEGPAVNNAIPTQTLDSFYVMGSYFLTGDARAYKAKSGAFDRVKPADKGGAWEIALRYDSADVDETNNDASSITLGVNYHATSHVRYMFNVIRSEFNDPTDFNGDGITNDEPTAYVVRWQLDF